ncbi:MAG: hypothetical protein FWD57_10755 [Polyangiaceae bacterium]|nr:hypothetical protein [Polyangiaceae bacterium]
MKLITSKEELIQNIDRLNGYLDNKLAPSYTFTLELIRRGICFVALQDKNEMRFYPSRFVGYKNNTMNDHLANEQRDGRETTPQISSIISGGQPPQVDNHLERQYVKYCTSLGFAASAKGAFGVERKYWLLSV